ncbi:DUF3159 domain-containing protein [Saccharomonospora saliphila]|uniref:DUF3159 domain-containing protein n=1 Tax=Saccharomonospora saliphila TaxID=369829 RepID=UPI0012FCD7AD|nr:DUF3159 domain-containing protein [Saccharomonospora saliphila]
MSGERRERHPGGPERESLADILGGRRGAVDATLPPVAFVLGWLLADSSIGWGAAAAIAVSVVVGVFRLLRREKVRAVLISLAAVSVAALIAVRTGRPEDFFLPQLLLNVASALVWAVSILVRWPLLGVVVGAVLGQRTRWRRDPDLLRAYARASWVWVLGQYTLRVVVFGALWWSGHVVALGTARVLLSWPLVAATLAVSGAVVYRTLPAGHPGPRHPRVPGDGPTERSTDNAAGTTEVRRASDEAR